MYYDNGGVYLSVDMLFIGVVKICDGEGYMSMIVMEFCVELKDKSVIV